MNYLYLAVSVIFCLAVGFTSGQLTTTDTAWFNDLEKPPIYPPGYLFGIVWTILYAMMGVSLYLVTQETKEKLPYILFGSQLILNFFWTLIFFGMQNIFLALVEIIALWILIANTIFVFRKYSTAAAYLLVPYILWVTFATVLTLSIFLLN